MRRLIITLTVILFVIAPDKVGAIIPDYAVVAKSNKENITIYAKSMNGLYSDFKIDFNGRVFSRPFWINVTNPTYAPKIHFEDINKDKKSELIVILTKGYGTGVLDQEVYVFHTDNNQLREVLVDNPIAIVNKNIKSSLNPKIAEITIENKHYIINVEELKLLPENLFSKISFGSIIKYEVKNNHLIVSLHPQFAPGAFVGSIIITYEYRDKMYQAASIEYQLEDYD